MIPFLHLVVLVVKRRWFSHGTNGWHSTLLHIHWMILWFFSSGKYIELCGYIWARNFTPNQLHFTPNQLQNFCGGLFPKMDEGTKKLRACRCFLCQKSRVFFTRGIEKKRVVGTSVHLRNTLCGCFRGFSIINHPFWDTTIFGNPHVGLLSYLLLVVLGSSWNILKHLRFLRRDPSPPKGWTEAFCHAPPGYLSLIDDGQEVILRKLQLKRWWKSWLATIRKGCCLK